MGASPFARALERISAPLGFAARDGFAHADRIRNLEESVRRAVDAAQTLAVPRDVRRRLDAIGRIFAEPLEGGERVAAVRRARAELAALSSDRFAESMLGRPTSSVPGVGSRRTEALAHRGFRNVSDLLFHLPARYDDRRSLLHVDTLEVGRRATFVARVLQAEFVTARGRGGRPRRVFQALVGDETGQVTLRWFHGGEALESIVRKGAPLLVTGDVRRYRFARELLHPDVERLDDETEGGETDAGTLRQIVPDYASPEGVPPRALRRIIRRAVEEHADLVASHLPPDLVRERELPDVSDALRAVHAPSPDTDLEALRARRTPAYARLVLEELYLLEIGLALRRAAREAEPGMPIPIHDTALRTVEAALPFRLTSAQRRVQDEIYADLARPHPMNRLLQGDVGSGKTAVAFLAAAAVAEAGGQTALMAPTELLAEQHARTLRDLAGTAGRGARVPRVALLTASLARSESEAVRRALAAGEIDLVVGTHALIQGDVSFARLALAVVDEQHRFGVLQRAGLAAKTQGRFSPHVLVMTATPIPRTLALTAYGDLDLSVIDELPPGRHPVATHVLRSGEGEQVVAAIRETLGRGEQVYVVYPLVEESERSDLRAATKSAERIRHAFSSACVDLMHGRLDPHERAAAMERFESGRTDILVSTTVIEVGVDVPNATLMVVEHAERFGLAQLHQLRGRVGRGRRPGACLLVARGSTEESEARLRALVETNDGFAIADADLRIRGPGEFLGTRQSGRLPDLRIADLLRDAPLLSVAREAALRSVRRDPRLRRSPALAHAVTTRWGARLALVDVG